MCNPSRSCPTWVRTISQPPVQAFYRVVEFKWMLCKNTSNCLPSLWRWLILKPCRKKSCVANTSLALYPTAFINDRWQRRALLESLHALFHSFPANLFSLLQKRKNQSRDKIWPQTSTFYPAVRNKLKLAFEPLPPAHFISSLDTPRCAFRLACSLSSAAISENWALASKFNAMGWSSTSVLGNSDDWNLHGS